nr:MAG TPA: hypothetical protein [Crassvirales sp.]
MVFVEVVDYIANHSPFSFDWDSPPSLDCGANYSSFNLE